MTEYMVWTRDDAPKGIRLKWGQRVRWMRDDDYDPRGSYAFDTPEETNAAEDWEIERLNDGRLIALGVILERQCRCGNWEHIDSCWGIVVEPDIKHLINYYKDFGFRFPKKGK